MPFACNLGELARKKNLTYAELLFQPDGGPGSVARVKDGRIATRRLQALEKLASARDVDVPDLYRREREEREGPGPSPCRMGQGRAGALLQ